MTAETLRFPVRPGDPARISADQLADAVKAGERGASDALDNRPPSGASVPSPTELDLTARVRELAASVRQEAADSFDRIHAEVVARRDAFIVRGYESRVASVEAALRGLIARHGGELEQKIYEALRAKREYEHFNVVHERTADPKLDKWQFILAFLVVPLSLESLLNGNFFAEASDFGLVGGAATAVIISALNIALGFLLGFGPARYVGHVRKSHLFWAVPAYAGLLLLILGFNLAVGHYREMLMATPDARTIAVMPRLLANPLGIVELKSIALVLIGCIVAFTAAMKGFTAFGRYPGHGAAFRRWRQSRDAVTTARQSIDANLLPELETVRARVSSFHDESRGEIAALQGLRSRADQALDQYRTRLSQLTAARDSALMQYREANMKVRTDSPPAYFSEFAPAAELGPTGPLPEHERLLQLIAEVERELANLPAQVEAKLEDRLRLVRGFDLSAEIERMKAGAAAAGRSSFEEDEAERERIRASLASNAPKSPST